MAGKYEAPKKPGGRITFLLLMLILASLLVAALLLMRPEIPEEIPVSTAGTETSATLPPETFLPTQPTAPTETDAPLPQLLTTATVSAQGDLLMHEPVISSGKQSDGSYDYSCLFRYLSPYLAEFDYSVMNLETTLGGSSYPYQGNPEFNCPDPIADALKEAGYDMVLTANNHASDTYTAGIFRTLEQLRSRDLVTLGTMLNGEEKKYEIVEVNGIRLGMICYTYATNELSEGQPSLNHRSFIKTKGIVNYFLETRIDRFLTEAEAHIGNMKADGAEAILFYIHWGREYVTQSNSLQEGLAQRLCDLGADVIIGGHPHVVQPVEYLESTVDPNHSAVCIYSLGNLVSNQMKGGDPAFASGHSEDGALFSVTFGKYDDGSVRVTAVDVLPTWVNRNSNSGNRRYDILPLDIAREDLWQQLYGLTDEQLAAAKESLERTSAIVSEGLEQCREQLEK